MTRITANIILLVMAGVWGWLSIKSGAVQPVSQNFIYIGGLVAAGEFVAAGDIASMVSRKRKANDSNTTTI